MEQATAYTSPGDSALSLGWKIPVAAVIFAFGMVAGRLLVYTLGLWMPRLPQQADESTAVYYLLGGSLLLAAAVLPVARALAARFALRWLLVFLFLYGCFGVSTTAESAIYSETAGYSRMMLVFLVPTALMSLFAAAVSGGGATVSFATRTAAYFRSRPAAAWLWRGLLALAAFPVVYLLFGMLAAPLVTDYYREAGFGLALPGIGEIIGMQFLRSLLFLLVTVPLMIVWSAGRHRLIGLLAFVHFVFVYAHDIVLAIQLPPILLVVHGIEIALDSLVYSWIFVTLLWPRSHPASPYYTSTGT